MHNATKIIHRSKQTHPTPLGILPSNVAKNISKTNPKANTKGTKKKTKQLKHLVACNRNSAAF
jgi:hypothetical protein